MAPCFRAGLPRFCCGVESVFVRAHLIHHSLSVLFLLCNALRHFLFSHFCATRSPNMATVYSDQGCGIRPPVVFYNRANEAAQVRSLLRLQTHVCVALALALHWNWLQQVEGTF